MLMSAQLPLAVDAAVEGGAALFAVGAAAVVLTLSCCSRRCATTTAAPSPSVASASATPEEQLSVVQNLLLTCVSTEWQPVELRRPRRWPRLDLLCSWRKGELVAEAHLRGGEDGVVYWRERRRQFKWERTGVLSELDLGVYI